MNPFRRMVTVGHNARVFVYNRRPTEREETAKRRSEGDMQPDAWYWRRARSNPPPGCLWRLWLSASTLTEPFRPDGNVFCWWSLYRFAVFARQKWQTVLVKSMNHCILCWLYCWARYWMFQDMDHMETSCIFYVKVGMFDQLEQPNICILTMTALGIVMQTIQYELIVSIWFMWDLGYFIRQISPDALSVKNYFVYLTQAKFRLWFTTTYPCKQSHNIGPTYFKSHRWLETSATSSYTQ